MEVVRKLQPQSLEVDQVAERLAKEAPELDGVLVLKARPDGLVAVDLSVMSPERLSYLRYLLNKIVDDMLDSADDEPL